MNILYQLNDDDCFFPPADHANSEGLLAFGGDLSPQRLIVAYANGIFPWKTSPYFGGRSTRGSSSVRAK